MDWTKLVNEYGNKLLLYARQWVGSVADAEEAVQEGFVKLWRSDNVRFEDAAPFLFAVVKRSAIDIYRGRKRRQSYERSAGAEMYENAAPLFETGIEQDETRLRVEKLLEKLPIEQREVLVMKMWGELTFDQIGKSLGISPNTAASRYRYAIEGLREYIGQDDL